MPTPVLGHSNIFNHINDIPDGNQRLLSLKRANYEKVFAN